MKSIQERWALFQSMAVAHGSSNELRAELRIAFFAGFTASLGANREIVRMRDADALDAIEQLDQEAKAFADSMGEPTDSMGIPRSCGKPLCAPGSHHPLCDVKTP